MKKLFFVTLIVSFLGIFLLSGCHSSTKNKKKQEVKDPAQDSPVFYGDNPMENLKIFAVILSDPQNEPIQKKEIKVLIKKELEKIGKVFYAQEKELGGFHEGTIMHVHIQTPQQSDGTSLPFTQANILIETPVTIRKTQNKSLSPIWRTETFAQKEQFSLAIQAALQNFITEYTATQHSSKRTPTFYIYE